jgi:all-trans-retinol 13,14-reductase
MYHRYTVTEDLTGFEYIIVGSGIGGLSTGVFLSKAKKKVLMLESHYVPGGFSQTFKRKDGFVWDVGVHYVGNMDKGSSFLRKIFDYLTDNQLNWEFMGEVYDEVKIGEDNFSFVAGKENLRKKLHDHFPNDIKAIDRYFKKIAIATWLSSLFFLQKSFPRIIQFTLGAIIKFLFYRISSRTTLDVLQSITTNEKLIGILCSQCGNYGLPPGKSSFAAHAIVTSHFLNGGYYPVGGSGEIFKSLLDTFFKNSGQLRIKAKVDEIVLEDGKVKGVKVNGLLIPCQNVISNAGAKNTFAHLLAKSTWSPTIGNVRPSTAHFCLYLGLDQSDEELKLPRHNVWYYDNYQFDEISKNQTGANEESLKFAYISFPSSKDPAWPIKNPTRATIQAVGAARYEWFTDFENKAWMKRGEVYEEVKSAFKEKMLEKLYEWFPQIKGHVVHAEVSTPLSTKHFTNYGHGEIYGLEHSPERFKLKSLLPKTSIKGLYLTGQDVVTVGVGGALASGLLCATQILKFRIARTFKAIATQKS